MFIVYVKHSMNSSLYLIAFSIMLVCSCTFKREEVVEDALPLASDNIQEVMVSIAQNKAFEVDILSNGKLESAFFADVYWKSEGEIVSVNVHNGQYVTAGSILAQLDSDEANRTEKSTAINLTQAEMQMFDVLIGQGFDPNKMESIPEKTLNLIKIKSGYSKMSLEHENALSQFANCTLKAPISGFVANVSTTGRVLNNTGKAFCRIIDRSEMNVNFSVIEAELPMLKEAQKVVVSPFSNSKKKYTGKITAINPIVGNEGMVEVTARINGDRDLYDGMGVSVHIKNMSGVYIAIPKSAVVLRAGRPVVFVANNGKAEWRYVTTTFESESQYAVSNGIEVGDSIIVSGNSDLAHNSEIKIKM